jgi:hypothetical protein|tara:strand:- start:919 stop:1263 length:345 start_codon:yes stop_codon:yes gene_type:complete
MGFYFFVFFTFGLIGGSSVKAQKISVSNIADTPLWVTGGYGQLAISISGFTWLLGAVSIFFQYDVGWMLVSIAEVFLGVIVATFMPSALNFILLLIAPIISITFLGALWGFWYI